MPRVLHLIKALDRGGAEQLLVNAGPHFVRSRFDYEVAYLLRQGDVLAGELRDIGLPVHCLEGKWALDWIRRLRLLVKQRRFDIVHTHSPYAATFARMVLWGERPRLVNTEHNVWSAYRFPTYWGNALTFPRNKYVFAVSHHVRDSIRYPSLLRVLPMPRVETLYHGIDPSVVTTWKQPDGVRDELGIPPHAPLVSCVANFRREKGHRYLLEALAICRRVDPEIQLVLVGGGRLEKNVRTLAGRLGLMGTVKFTGTRADAARIAGASDLFVLASLQEGLAIALLEAMAMGCPVVVTNVGGMPEVVEDGRHGVVVPPRDPKRLADAILRLLDDPGLRSRMGMEARRRAAQFDICHAVERSEKVYEELLG
ncbi:MAG: glycosyltransferase [Actinomycetota bacterium]